MEGGLDDSQHYHEEAMAEARNARDVLSQGEAMIRLSVLMWSTGDTTRRDALSGVAVEVLERQPPGAQLVTAYVLAALNAIFSGRSQLALEWSEKALALADLLGDERVTVMARSGRGGARCDLGDPGGLDDLRAAVRDGLGLGLGENTTVAYGNLAEWTWWIEGPDNARQVYEDYIQFAERRGLKGYLMHAKAEFLRVLFDLGEWDEIVRSAGDLLRWGKEHRHRQVEVTVLFNQAQVLVWRGQASMATAMKERLLELARSIQDLQVLVPALATASLMEQAHGDDMAAVALVNELYRVTREHHAWRARYLPTAIRILVSAGQIDQATEFISGMKVTATRDRHCILTGRAIVAEANKEFGKAAQLHQELAQRWADYGFVLEEGQAHLGLARCLIALGNREAATDPLHKARAIFERLGAVPLINETDSHFRAEAAS